MGDRIFSQDLYLYGELKNFHVLLNHQKLGKLYDFQTDPDLQHPKKKVYQSIGVYDSLCTFIYNVKQPMSNNHSE